MKTDKNKQLLVDQLRKTPIVLVVCEKQVLVELLSTGGTRTMKNLEN